MARLVEQYPPPGSKKADPYVKTIYAVVGQQLSTHAARTIIGRLEDNVGHDALRLRRVRQTTLRKQGLSGAKSRTVKEIAACKIDGLFDELDSDSDDVVREKLTSIKGVGPWTADMVLMFALLRKDIWPVGDGGIQRAAIDLYGVQDEQLLALGDRFRPYRSSAAWYLWRHLES